MISSVISKDYQPISTILSNFKFINFKFIKGLLIHILEINLSKYFPYFQILIGYLKYLRYYNETFIYQLQYYFILDLEIYSK